MLERDAADPLAGFRAAFDLPDGLIYLDGNSLGAFPRRAREIAERVLLQEWRDGLIRSWNDADWFTLPRRIGDKIAQLIGADAGEVVMADSTSVNLFKVLNAALQLRPGRKNIVSERDNFPTDLYMAEGLAQMRGQGHQLRLVDGPEQIGAALAEDCAVLMLTHVNYRDGRMHDMARITRLAHENGALVIWDLAHSAGAVPVDLKACDVDFAVGCTYKYLNGGPGAPAFVYAARRWQLTAEQPLSGWWGHATPFAFDAGYRPEQGIGRFLVGSPPIVSMAIAEAGIDLMLEATIAQVRAKSLLLGASFIALVRQECADLDLGLASPEDADMRGSQVSLAHPQGYAIMQALAARGVVGDYREPGILRFGFAPLYLRHADIWDAVATIKDVMITHEWELPQFSLRRAVT